MPPPYNEMIPPGAPRVLAKEVFSPAVVLGQAVLSCLPRVRRALSGEFDAMRIVHEAVENGVGVGGIANDLVPRRERELGSDDRRSAVVTLFEDFEQIVRGAGIEGFEAEVVENEEIGAAEGFDQARMASVASGERPDHRWSFSAKWAFARYSSSHSFRIRSLAGPKASAFPRHSNR
jgi:hypothetical protein